MATCSVTGAFDIKIEITHSKKLYFHIHSNVAQLRIMLAIYPCAVLPWINKMAPEGSLLPLTTPQHR